MKKNLKPLGQMFKTTWETFEKHWSKYVGITAIFTITLFVVMFLLILGLVLLQFAGILGAVPFAYLFEQGNNTGAAIGGVVAILLAISFFFIAMLVIFAIAFLFNSWQMSSLINIVSQKKLAGLPVFEIIKKSWPRVKKMFLALLLTTLIIMVGYMLLIIPGIIFGLWLSQVFFLIMIKDLSIVDAMKKSKELVKGNMWKVFLYNLAAIALMYVFIIGANIIPFLGMLIAPLLGIVITPLLIIFQYQIYLGLQSK